MIEFWYGDRSLLMHRLVFRFHSDPTKITCSDDIDVSPRRCQTVDVETRTAVSVRRGRGVWVLISWLTSRRQHVFSPLYAWSPALWVGRAAVNVQRPNLLAGSKPRRSDVIICSSRRDRYDVVITILVGDRLM